MAADWIDALEARPAPEVAATSEIRLIDYPVLLAVKQQQQTAEMMREFQLIILGEPETHVLHEVVEFAATMWADWGEALTGPREELERAVASGQPYTELRYPVLPDSRANILRYARLMERAEDYCRSGELISLAASPDVYALRRWLVEEFVRQHDGEPPRPWPRPDTDPSSRAGTAHVG
jgi:hypothetical protein